MNTPGFNQGKNDGEKRNPLPKLDQASAAERENYWRGRQSTEKK